MTLHTDFFGILVALIMGLGSGSYATMAVYRLPRNMPWIGDKPRCLMCKHELYLIDYFSIISFFLWRGTCRYCKGSYECNYSYFLTELFITIGMVLTYMRYGFGDRFVPMALLLVAFTIIAVISYEHKKIPAKTLISALLIAAVYRTFLDQNYYGALYSGVLGFILALGFRHLYFFVKKDAKTGFDYMKWQHEDRFVGPFFDYVKLFIVIAILLPFKILPLFLILTLGLGYLWYSLLPKSFNLAVVMSLLAWAILWVYV